MGSAELYNVLLDSTEISLFLIALAILISIIVVLKILERRWKRVLAAYKGSRNLYYQRKINELRNIRTTPRIHLDLIENTARDFFREAFKIPPQLEYSELIEEFNKNKKKECADFCKIISDINYSGETIDDHRIAHLLDLLENIIKNNSIYSREDEIIRKELERFNKSKKQQEIKPQENLSEEKIREFLEKKSLGRISGRISSELGQSLKDKIKERENLKEDNFY